MFKKIISRRGPSRKEFVETIKNLNEKEKKVILDVFRESFPDKFEEVVDRIKIGLKLDRDDVIDIILSFVSMYITYYQLSVSIDEYLDSELYEDIREFLKEILSMDESLGIVSKMLYLESVTGDPLVDATIITDLRPIYFKDPLKESEYGIIRHTLHLEVRKSGRLESIDLVLDNDSLKKLSKITERAQNKQKTLENQCKKNNIKIFKELEISNE